MSGNVKAFLGSKLSPTASAILSIFDETRADRKAQTEKKITDAIEQLAALPRGEQGSVVREVNSAVGFNPMKWTDKLQYPERKKYARLIDEILAEAPNRHEKPNLLKVLPALRADETFYFDDESAISEMGDQLVCDLIPHFARFPFKRCWFEFPGMGIHIECADDTFQRGFLKIFENKKQNCISMAAGSTILFDFTEGFVGFDADSGDVARSFRDHVARCSDMMSPG